MKWLHSQLPTKSDVTMWPSLANGMSLQVIITTYRPRNKNMTFPLALVSLDQMQGFSWRLQYLRYLRWWSNKIEGLQIPETLEVLTWNICIKQLTYQEVNFYWINPLTLWNCCYQLPSLTSRFQNRFYKCGPVFLSSILFHLTHLYPKEKNYLLFLEQFTLLPNGYNLPFFMAKSSLFSQINLYVTSSRRSYLTTLR